MPIQMTLKAPPHGVPVKLWTDTAQSEALDQLKNVARLPSRTRTSRRCRTCTTAGARRSGA